MPSLRRAVTIVETAISIVIVGTMLVAVMNTAGGAILGRSKTGDTHRWSLLAQDLMSEILGQAYEEPIDDIKFGRESGESGSSRANYDDVDDYFDWKSNPPEYMNGADFANLDSWERTVSVKRVQPTDLSAIVGGETGIKRITVTVIRNGATVAELVGLKSQGLPPPEKNSLSVLLVVNQPGMLTAQEDARKTLMETWTFSVATIAASAPQAGFDSHVGDDVAYVSMEISDAELGTKLRNAAIGVVNENILLTYDFGLSSSIKQGNQDSIKIDDNTHYITSPFATGMLTITTSTQPLSAVAGSAPENPKILSYTNTSGAIFYPSLVALESGMGLVGGGTSAARRVQLPWGWPGFDFTALNADGQTIMRRAIEWAAGKEAGGATCGDATCDTGEDPCTCPDDCGVVTASEVSGATCTDGIDNDCDGLTDCDDADCGADAACVPAVCGNGTCEPGETCGSCSIDCASLLTGKPSGWYCCGNGTLESAEGDGTICDGNP